MSPFKMLYFCLKYLFFCCCWYYWTKISWYLSSHGHLPCNIHIDTIIYTWKHIIGRVLFAALVDYLPGLTRLGQIEQNFNTNFQWGRACLPYEKGNIADISMSVFVLYYLLPLNIINIILDLFQPNMFPMISFSFMYQKYLFIVGIGPILNIELEFILQSDRPDRTCFYTYVPVLYKTF